MVLFLWNNDKGIRLIGCVFLMFIFLWILRRVKVWWKIIFGLKCDWSDFLDMFFGFEVFVMLLNDLRVNLVIGLYKLCDLFLFRYFFIKIYVIFLLY